MGDQPVLDQQLGDFLFELIRRQPGRVNSSGNQRVADFAGIADPHVAGQLGHVEHLYVEHVAGADGHVVRLGARQRRQFLNLRVCLLRRFGFCLAVHCLRAAEDKYGQ